jgi:hypothetical protein
MTEIKRQVTALVCSDSFVSAFMWSIFGQYLVNLVMLAQAGWPLIHD